MLVGEAPPVRLLGFPEQFDIVWGVVTDRDPPLTIRSDACRGFIPVSRSRGASAVRGSGVPRGAAQGAAAGSGGGDVAEQCGALVEEAAQRLSIVAQPTVNV